MIPCKRALQVDEAADVSKKAKMDSKGAKAKTEPNMEEDALKGSSKCDTDTHLNESEALNQRLKQNELEIESLREQLRQKDFEISSLHKMVASLKNRKSKRG